MDGPLILLFCLVWEHMPFLAPIPRDQLGDVGIPLARWWSHWRRHTRYIRRLLEHFRRALDDMRFDDRPYMGVGVPNVLAPHLVICSTQSPLVSFECIEWHPTCRVRRQFGMQQLPPGPTFDLCRDHYKRLTGAQNHDCGEIYSQWLGEEIIDFHPLPVYYEWYTQQYGMHLRLSDRVAGSGICPAVAGISAAPEPYIPQLVIPAEGCFSLLGGSNTISFSQVLSHTDFLSPPPPQEGPATSQHSGGHRATSGHASDFDFDDPTGHVDPPGPSAPPRGQLFDLNEYPQQEDGDLGYDLQHWYDLGGASAPGMSGSGLYDTGGASMTDFGGSDIDSGLDAAVSQGRPYNLRIQTAPPNKYTPSLYAKKAPRK
ncbi:hypothetical protein Ahy_A05g024940 [Arachis hypogaea]|uniref:Aminotransferase-like plant mobile domain-containing protein n=1 Tax=Arachis hypogaea TaxID=3818 RepID=A0A445D7X2_ARAHY|nr:hypothetical protein Ahy_A05g024940 [Arachis hypogaea]